VPYLLGFHPGASAVLLSLRGPRQTMGVLVRADLPPPGAEQEFAVSAAAHLARDRAAQAVLVVYAPAADAPPPGEVPRGEVADAILAALAARGIAVAEALCVCGDRWWSYRCRGGSCCPPSGTPTRWAGPQHETSVVAASAAFAGLHVLPDREALAATLGPPGEAEPALVRVFAGVREQLRTRGAGPAAGVLRAESTRLLETAVDRFRLGARDLTDERVARLVLGLDDKHVRDAACEWIHGPSGAAALALWRELARRSPAGDDVEVLVVLAWSAWSQGEGALARIAVDRALAAAPAHTLGGLVDEGLSRGVPPRHLHEALLNSRRRQLRGPG
jgi:hypothetical protein